MNRTIQTTTALLIAFTGISIAFAIPPAVQGQMESKMSQSSMPTFYRGGEKVEPRMHEELPLEPMEERSVFEEEAVEEMENGELQMENEEEEEIKGIEEIEENEEIEDTQSGDTSPQSEELTKPAARESMFMQLMRQMKYVIGAVGLALAGGFYWYISKPKAKKVTQEVSHDVPEKPNGNGDVAESSKRLEQALKAMENDK